MAVLDCDENLAQHICKDSKVKAFAFPQSQGMSKLDKYNIPSIK